MTSLKSFSANRLFPAIVVAACFSFAVSFTQADETAYRIQPSPGDEVRRELGRDSLIAVFPIENLSGTAVAMKEIREEMIRRIRKNGLNVLPEDVLEKFLERHRERYTSGLSRELGQTLRKETGTKAVLITSLDLYGDMDPLKVAFTSRLVSTGETPVISWMESVARAGNDTPGILGLGLVREHRVLQAKVMATVVDSLTDYLSGELLRTAGKKTGNRPVVSMKGRFRPRGFFLQQGLSGLEERPLRVAVLPFFNESGRKNAAEIIRLHFLRRLSERNKFIVIDPGEIRLAILKSRTIIEGGLSLPQADLLREFLDADIFFTGSVKDYQESGGIPVVNFSSMALDARKRKVIWSSISHNAGDDGVFFFGWGKMSTAHGMASEMVEALIEKVTKGANERRSASVKEP